jgi:hypothetical protein
MNGFSMILHGSFIGHIAVARERIAKWKPAVLEVVVYDLAF